MDYNASLDHSFRRTQSTPKLILAALALMMVATGGARAVGGFFLMSAGEARKALALGAQSPQPLPVTVTRLKAATRWWPYDARAWDAYGALRLEAAYETSGTVTAKDALLAVNAFHHAVSLAPEQPLFWMRRSAAEAAAGKPDAAVRSLKTSIEAGEDHPQALRFRFQLGVALWEHAPVSMRAAIANQGAAAFRQGRAEAKFIARQLRKAPPQLRLETLIRLTQEEREMLSRLLTN